MRLDRGFITLFSVLIIGAVGAAVAISLMLFSVGFLKTSFSIEQSNQSKAFANACAEQALQWIRANPDYTGSGYLSFPQGACNYNVSNGAQITIQSQGNAGAITRKVKIEIDSASPLIHIVSWQEVADF